MRIIQGFFVISWCRATVHGSKRTGLRSYELHPSMRFMAVKWSCFAEAT